VKDVMCEVNFLDEYQHEALKLAFYPSIGHNIVYPTLGLVGESGEFADKIKKLFRDRKGVLDEPLKAELRKELGDVLWYVAALSQELGSTLKQIAEMNLQKLSSRHARGVLGGNGDNR